MKVTMQFLQLLVKEAEMKRSLLTSFIVTTLCWNHHTYISIILLPSTCLSSKVMEINWEVTPGTA